MLLTGLLATEDLPGATQPCAAAAASFGRGRWYWVRQPPGRWTCLFLAPRSKSGTLDFSIDPGFLATAIGMDEGSVRDFRADATFITAVRGRCFY